MPSTVKKLYYSIGEVSDITDLKPYVLRYWETEFSTLAPSKNPAGNRIYTEKDIHQILEIKRLLYQEKFTIEGARNYLKNGGNGGAATASAKSTATHTTRIVYEKDSARKAVEEIHEALNDLLELIRREK